MVDVVSVLPRRNRLTRRGLFGSGVLGLLALLWLARVAINVWTDSLWFSDIGQIDTWGRMLSAKLTLALGASVFAFVCVSASILVAQRNAPNEVRVSERDPLLGARIFAATHPHATRNALAGICALMIGPAAAGAWNEWLLYRHGTAGPKPEFASFGKSIGFYLFELPFLTSLTSWLFVLIVLAAVFTLTVMALMGSARFDPLFLASSARRHLTVLFAIALLVRAVGFWLARFALTGSRHAHFDGMNYVDQHVRAPGHLAMAAVSVLGAVVLLATVRRRGWAVSAGVGGAWLGLSILVLGIVPAIWQRIALSDELARETPSLMRNKAATVAAFDLGNVERAALRATSATTGDPDEFLADADGLRNLRLWDVATGVTAAAFDTAQKVYPNLQIVNVDADRTVNENGFVVPRLIAVREPEPQGTSWIAQRLNFTHGFGIVTATGGASADGGPDFVVRNLPSTGSPKLTEPRVYFGEYTDRYAITNTATKEIDFGGSAIATAPPYRGTTGIGLHSFARRVAFAVRFGDLNVLLSKSITSTSKVLWTREIRARVARAAPFLHFDSDPLPVVYRGRLLWVLEGYTTSSTFPNSDRSMASTLAGSLNDGTVSYARNSVRVIVDAYNGETRFFRNENADPIVAVYDVAFPKLFDTRTFDERFPGLRDQVRYPRDLFGLRAALWGRFHTDSASDLFTDSDRWVPGSATADSKSEPTGPALNPTTQATVRRRPGFAPVEYLVGDPEGTGTQEFLAQRALVTRAEKPGNERLRALVIARSDRGRYGRLTALAAATSNLESPASTAAQLSSTPEISERETSLGRGGSMVINGEVQVIRVGDALLYVRALYVNADRTNKPLLRYVEVRFRDRTGFAPTLAGALRQVTGADARTPDLAAAVGSKPGTGPSTGATGSGATGSGATGSGPEAVSVDGLLADASAAYDAAQERLAKGDLGGYQAKVDEMGALIERARSATPAVPATERVSAASDTAPDTVP